MEALHNGKSRLRAIELLLDYVIAESQELEASELEQLLSAAALVVGEMIEGGRSLRRPRRAEKPALRVVTGDKKGNPKG